MNLSRGGVSALLYEIIIIQSLFKFYSLLIVRSLWTETEIIVRGDSAYSREEIFAFCEELERVEYFVAMGTNRQLQLSRHAELIAYLNKTTEYAINFA
jgi:hypothetical protein